MLDVQLEIWRDCREREYFFWCLDWRFYTQLLCLNIMIHLCATFHFVIEFW